MTKENEEDFENSTKCWICNNVYELVKFNFKINVVSNAVKK